MKILIIYNNKTYNKTRKILKIQNNFNPISLKMIKFLIHLILLNLIKMLNNKILIA